jgi:hypothetical protein
MSISKTSDPLVTAFRFRNQIEKRPYDRTPIAGRDGDVPRVVTTTPVTRADPFDAIGWFDIRNRRSLT